MAVTILFAPTLAIAKCGTGNPPSYDDITAIRFERQKGFWTAPKAYRATTFKGSAFLVFFSNLDATKYSQYDLLGQIGTYRLSAGLKEAATILRNDEFFALSSPEVLITDVQWDVLSVRRCSVITAIELPDASDVTVDVKTRKLLEDLEALIVGSSKTKLSEKPQDSDYNIFDP